MTTAELTPKKRDHAKIIALKLKKWFSQDVATEVQYNPNKPKREEPENSTVADDLSTDMQIDKELTPTTISPEQITNPESDASTKGIEIRAIIESNSQPEQNFTKDSDTARPFHSKKSPDIETEDHLATDKQELTEEIYTPCEKLNLNSVSPPYSTKSNTSLFDSNRTASNKNDLTLNLPSAIRAQAKSGKSFSGRGGLMGKYSSASSSLLINRKPVDLKSLKKRLIAISAKRNDLWKLETKFLKELDTWTNQPNNTEEQAIRQLSSDITRLFKQDIICEQNIAKHLQKLSKDLDYVWKRENQVNNENKTLQMEYKKYNQLKVKKGYTHPDTVFTQEKIASLRQSYDSTYTNYKHALLIDTRIIFKDFALEFYESASDLRDQIADFVSNSLHALESYPQKMTQELETLRLKRLNNMWSKLSEKERSDPRKLKNFKSGVYERTDPLIKTVYKNISESHGNASGLRKFYEPLGSDREFTSKKEYFLGDGSGGITDSTKLSPTSNWNSNESNTITSPWDAFSDSIFEKATLDGSPVGGDSNKLNIDENGYRHIKATEQTPGYLTEKIDDVLTKENDQQLPEIEAGEQFDKTHCFQDLDYSKFNFDFALSNMSLNANENGSFANEKLKDSKNETNIMNSAQNLHITMEEASNYLHNNEWASAAMKD